jgi:uncharacterized protein (TIGR00661 family)
MSLSMLLQSPKILLGIKKEKIALEEIIKDYNIDGVISDNRFGLSTKKVPCTFITHQLQIQSPYFTAAIQQFNYNYINRFNACWVMDDEKENLAGSLSKPEILPDNTIYIGMQSRFEKREVEKKYEFLGIVSGPEPQRSILEKGLIKALQGRKGNSLIVLGKTELSKSEQIGNLTIRSHLNAENLNTAILQAELIICRPGYSTIMDLAKLGKKAIFIPTPGQTEQEYLAEYFMEKGICFAQKQNDFNLQTAIDKSTSFTGFNTKEKTTDWQTLFYLFEGE